MIKSLVLIFSLSLLFVSQFTYSGEIKANKQDEISIDNTNVSEKLNPELAEVFDITINNSWTFSTLTFSDKENYYIENRYLPSDLLGIINDKYFTYIADKKYLKLNKSILLEENLDYLRLKFKLNEDYFISQDVLTKKEKKRESHPIDSAFINYDLNIPLEDPSYSRGFFDMTYASTDNWKIKNSYLWDSKEFIRLSTYWTKGFEKGVQLTLGDTSTTTTGNFGSSNIFGVKYSTAYFTQSSAVLDSLPVLTLNGFAENPTKLDLYINNQKVQQSEIEAGRYNLKIPYKTSGYGLAEAYVYDITGKPVVVSIPFYNSMEMLKPGVQEYEVSAGVMRQNFGIDDFDYSNYAASGIYKRGITDWYTQDIFAQYSDLYWSSSWNGHFTPIKMLGIIHAGYSLNSENQSLYRFGIDRASQSFSLGFDIKKSSGNDFFCYGYYITCIKSETRFYAGGGLPYKLGSLNFNYIERDEINELTKIKNLQYVKQLNSIFGLFASYNEVSGNQKNKTGYIGLSVNLGGISSNSSITKSANDTSYQVGIYKSEDNKHPEYGYGSLTLNKSTSAESANFYYGSRLDHFNYQLNVFKNKTDTLSNLNVAGGLVYIHEENFLEFTKPIQSGIAFVKIKNLKEPIRIDHENRFSGYTDSKGRYLIPTAVALNNERVTIDINNLPVGVTMENYKAEYFVPSSGAVRVDFVAKPLPFVITIKGVSSGMMFNIDEDYFVIGDNGEASVDKEGKAIIPLSKDKNCEINIVQTQKEYSCIN